MLTAVTVNNAFDLVNGNTSSITAIVNDDGGDGISLREAILAANHSEGADEVTFDNALSGQTITLDGSPLAIREALTIDARSLSENLIIDADELSRVLIIDAVGTTADDFDVSLKGLTLTGGRTLDLLERGGAILSFATGTLTLEESTVIDNNTLGDRAGGGGIRAIGDLVLLRSTLSGNSTQGEFSRGGGIDALGTVTIIKSTISGNGTSGPNADGGGIRAQSAVTVMQSTITDNHALDAGDEGGGIWNDNDPIVIDNSIIAGNSAGAADNDLRPGNGTLSVNYSLIGDTSDMSVTELLNINAGLGNLLDIDPMLKLLADNGGPTFTQELLAGSPALDVGDPNILFEENEFDQRGESFLRVANSRIDIGAFELQVEMTADPLADFDGDEDVDGADFLAWQRGLGIVDANKQHGDADDDLDVDEDDLNVWQEQFGQPIMAASKSVSSSRDPHTPIITSLHFASISTSQADLIHEPLQHMSISAELVNLESNPTIQSSKSHESKNISNELIAVEALDTIFETYEGDEMNHGTLDFRWDSERFRTTISLF